MKKEEINPIVDSQRATLPNLIGFATHELIHECVR